MFSRSRMTFADFSLDPIDSSVVVNINPNRDAFFGDLHVHTMYSFDAFIFGTTASPDDAYTDMQREVLSNIHWVLTCNLMTL